MSGKKKILFVDDEPKILQALKRMLHAQRREWDMTFVEKGREALEVLEQNEFDVIISDMRMPGMDGAEFLTEVRERFPNVARIVLSGQSDNEMTMRAVGPTHQYLSKPCSAEMLQSTIARTCALRDMLADSAVQRIASGLTTIPSVPDLYLNLIRELEADEASLENLAAIITKDIGMTAKILQLVNSSFFGHGQNISDPEQAVNLLGVDTIRTLVLSIDIFSEFDQHSIPGFSVKELWEHSMATGVFARQITIAEGGNVAACNAAFSAGVLHDVGTMVLAANLPDEYAQVLALVQGQGLACWKAEEQIFGATHAEIGAYLLGLWGLPDVLVEAVAYHHVPEKCIAKDFQPLSAVHTANHFVNVQQSASRNMALHTEVNLEYLRGAGVEKHLADWQLLCEVTHDEGLTEKILASR
ncbi:response regulator [Oligoflexia bacterium]|nr:response regulator [Oligoflexia bacterium]